MSAAARATAMDTARIALAPSFDLFGVPSSSSKRRSMACCSSADRPTMAGPSLSLMLATAFCNALAQVALLVVVTEFDGFVLASRRPARHRGAAEAGVGLYFGFDRRVSPGIEDLACDDVEDFGHACALITTCHAVRAKRTPGTGARAAKI